jgi:uncharacterized protein YycO
MKILFCKSNTLGGMLIRFFTFSKWSHVAIELGDNVIDSTFSKGVAVSSKESFYKRYDYIETIEVEVDKELSTTFLINQIGKPYDWSALIALPLRNSWQNPDAWFCSELVAKTLAMGGKYFKAKASRITPEDLWKLL